MRESVFLCMAQVCMNCGRPVGTRATPQASLSTSPPEYLHSFLRGHVSTEYRGLYLVLCVCAILLQLYSLGASHPFLTAKCQLCCWSCVFISFVDFPFVSRITREIVELHFHEIFMWNKEWRTTFGGDRKPGGRKALNLYALRSVLECTNRHSANQSVAQ